MVWLESPPPQAAPSNSVDITYKLVGQTLPGSHAQALATAVCAHLDWLEQFDCGVHAIQSGPGGNGWQRPQGAHATIHLSARTRLALRIPRSHINAAAALSGQTVDIDGHTLAIGKASVRELQPTATLFARRIASQADISEAEFVEQAAQQLREYGIEPRKLLCGKDDTCTADSGPVFTRALMVADLGARESLELQVRGLGAHRILGCGIFVGHKSIAPVT